MLVQWDPILSDQQNGIVLGYFLLAREGTGGSAVLVQQMDVEDNLQTTLSGLKMYTLYSFYILGYTSKGNGTLSEAVVQRTAEDRPSGAPQQLRLNTSDSTTMTLAWDPVSSGSENGIVTGYILSYKRSTDSDGMYGNESDVYSEVDVGAVRLGLIPGLRGALTYDVRVAAYTSAGVGFPSKAIQAMTGEGAPSSAPSNVKAVSQSPTAVLVSWDPLPPRDRNGIIAGYMIDYKMAADTDRCARISCTPLDECHQAGECVNGVCSNPVVQDYVTCEDEDDETINDVCLGGVCMGTPLPGHIQAPPHVDTYSMDTRSHGGGYNPREREYHYPQWSGSTIYRYDDNQVLQGSFEAASGQSSIMQYWGDTDGSYVALCMGRRGLCMWVGKGRRSFEALVTLCPPFLPSLPPSLTCHPPPVPLATTRPTGASRPAPSPATASAATFANGRPKTSGKTLPVSRLTTTSSTASATTPVPCWS